MEEKDIYDKAAREKYWSECDEKMKCERLRQQVKGIQREVSMLSRFARYMQNHTHMPDGSVVVPLFMKDEPCLNEYSPTRIYTKDEEVYF